MKLKTEWKKLPANVRQHLEQRLRDRITVDDLYKLKFWLEQPLGTNHLPVQSAFATPNRIAPLSASGKKLAGKNRQRPRLEARECVISLLRRRW